MNDALLSKLSGRSLAAADFIEPYATDRFLTSFFLEGREYQFGIGLPSDMTTLYRLTADGVVVVHFAFVVFVIGGLLLTIVGSARRWCWVRHFWFRIAHLAAIGFVVTESLCGITCPLTVWEQRLRNLAGQASYRGDFITTWMHDVIFFDAEPWVFTLIYSLFGTAVMLTWILVPPKRRRVDSPVQSVGCPPDSGPIGR